MAMSGWLAFLGAVIVSRIINERGYRGLGPDEKVRLMDGFSAARAYGLIPLVALIAVFWVVSTQTNVDRTYVGIGYFSLLILYVIVRAFLNHRKLIQLQMPSDYRRAFTIAQSVSFIGIAWFFFALVYANDF